MTIQFGDLTAAEQTELARWETDVLPPLIASLTQTLANVTVTKDELQLVEDIFKQIYDSFETVMRSGFLLEVEGLNGFAFTDAAIDAALISAAADNPLNVPLLFPPLSLVIDPVQTAELTAVLASFQVTNAPFTGVPPASTPTGFNENQALTDEATELAGAPSLPDVIDYWQAQEAALQKQVTALNALNLEIDAGEPGKANIATALSQSSTALGVVQALILAGVLPPASRLSTDIPARQAEIATRIVQITDAATGDQLTYRDERYYWLRKRLNLSYGSLRRLKSTEKSIVDVTKQIADLVAEVAFYQTPQFRP